MSAELPLSERIRERFASLPAKQQAVARILADKPATVALASVSDLARNAGVDAATVVRTCQSLGYSGWRELLAHVKGDMARNRTFADRVAVLGSQEGNLTARILENAGRNVDETFDGLDESTFDKVAHALSNAGMVVVVAGGVSTGAGEFLTSSLRIIGVRCILVTGISDAAPALATLCPDDVVVGLSMWRYLTSTVQALQHAQQQVGATTVALTDSRVSSATRFADYTLVASTSTVGPRLSMTGVTALIEALVARTALWDPRRSQAAAAVASDLYFDGHVLADHGPEPEENQSWSWDATLAKEIGDG